MPIRNCIIHHIDKKPDGSPAILSLAASPLPPSDAADNLLQDLNETYNAKAGKAWGLFYEQSGAFPLSGWLQEYFDGNRDFSELTRTAAEQLLKLLEESNLATGGHVLFAHYQQGMTDYLAIAVLQMAERTTVNADLSISTTRHIDLGHLQMAARINISEWRNNPSSKQYISFIKGKNGKRTGTAFQDFIGCQEGVDSASETRILLKAFSDFIESEDLPEDAAREKTATLIGYTAAQAKMGEPITLEELSSLIDEDRPKAFYEHIRNKDYGLSAEIPADKRTLSQFRRFTGRTEGLSISFEAHLLGSKIEFNEGDSTLVIHSIPSALADQLKRQKSAES